MEIITFSSLNIDPLIYFEGSDEEIDAAEAKEAEREKEIKSLFKSPGFTACLTRDENGSFQILHKSSRQGVDWQLSFFWPDGSPVRHENYMSGDRELYRSFVNKNLRHDLTLEVVTE